MARNNDEYPFQARCNGKYGKRMKTPLGAVKKVIKDFEGPTRVEVYERGELLVTIHGDGEQGVIMETKSMFARNRLRG